MLSLDELATFLAEVFAVGDDPDAVNGIYRPSDRSVARLGVALEPWPALGTWARAERLDALFLHRPWRLTEGMLPAEVGVIAYHRAFDERLTLGFNPDLAAVLDLHDLGGFGIRASRPIGMLGTVPVQAFATYASHLWGLFGGLERTWQGQRDQVVRVAVVGAMTDALVREAAQLDIDVYVTGQWRQPAAAAVQATGINVVVVGHRRSEEWALQQLVQLVQQRWPTLAVILPTTT